jgi:hypothetical protein
MPFDKQHRQFCEEIIQVRDCECNSFGGELKELALRGRARSGASDEVRLRPRANSNCTPRVPARSICCKNLFCLIYWDTAVSVWHGVEAPCRRRRIGRSASAQAPQLRNFLSRLMINNSLIICIEFAKEFVCEGQRKIIILFLHNC